MGSPSPGIVGIDLGTTHTVVAHVDASRAIAVFPVAQRVGPREEEPRALLPSVLYAPVEGEEALDPYGAAPWVSGLFARLRGLEVPGRSVVSAKSWLAHAAVDRTAPILPWGGADDAPRISPLEASARYLSHVRTAWNLAHPAAPLEAQEVVLTVPASFDDAARDLTRLAAEQAGLTVTLLEEPLAAFYHYLHHARDAELRGIVEAAADDARVLVVDIGGGTTDLSLLAVRKEGGELVAERIATGPHLLLGGDNLDLALAHQVEAHLQRELTPRELGQLLLACRGAKETLLGPSPPAAVPIAISGAGSKLVGGTLRAELTREQVERLVMDGFFPEVGRGERPRRASSALLSFGLPYERDPAITRHIAKFLGDFGDGRLPDAVLLNGGAFHAPAIVQRVVSLLSAWAGRTVPVLGHRDPDLAVAKGAAASALARRGHGLRVVTKAARGYYLGLEGKGLCVLPRGTPEAVRLRIERTFELRRGEPVRFELWVSEDARTDAVSTLVSFEDGAWLRLPPLTARLRGEGTVRAELEARLLEAGTLELSFVDADGARHRLAFGLAPTAPNAGSVAPAALSASIPASARKVDQALACIAVFGRKDASRRDIVDLPRDLERILGDRGEWSAVDCRALFDALVAERGARRRSAEHERVFWHLLGFLGRPGAGFPGDDARIATVAPLLEHKLAFPDRAQGWQAFFVALRRLAAGFPEDVQSTLFGTYEPFFAGPERKLKKPKWTPAAGAEMRSMMASLERVPSARRGALGSFLMDLVWTDPTPALLADLGQIGARVPAYASAHHVVDARIVEAWVDQLLRTKWESIPDAPRAFLSLARLTGDRARDLGKAARESLERRLAKAKVDPAELRPLREVVELDVAARTAYLGEGLPQGVRLVE